MCRKRWLADLLSAGNCACGVAIIYVAYHHFQYQYGGLSAPPPPLDFSACFWLLALSTVCDALDGPAARKFGGSKYGIWYDTLADSVSYGVAPAAVLWFAIPGRLGAVLGATHVTCTFARLIIFVLTERQNARARKRATSMAAAAAAAALASGESLSPASAAAANAAKATAMAGAGVLGAAASPSMPTPFCGMPSPVGALLTMSCLHLVLCDAGTGLCTNDVTEPTAMATVAFVEAITVFSMTCFNTPYHKLAPATVREYRTAIIVSAVTLIIAVTVLSASWSRAFVAFALSMSFLYALSPSIAFVVPVVKRALI